MLSNSDILGSINLKVDYCMSPFSLDEHGWNLIAVNHYELCAIDALEQDEWWPFVHCMYGLQSCLNYNTTEASAEANQTCIGADSGADDDMTMTGREASSLQTTSCECSLTGVVDFCATTHTSTTLSELTDCAYSDAGHDLAVKSKKIAEQANSGDPLWIKVNNMTITLAKDETHEIGKWAESVFLSTCSSVHRDTGSIPKSCAKILQR